MIHKIDMLLLRRPKKSGEMGTEELHKVQQISRPVPEGGNITKHQHMLGATKTWQKRPSRSWWTPSQQCVLKSKGS